MTNDETNTESVLDDNAVTEANSSEVIKELNTENSDGADTLRNKTNT